MNVATNQKIIMYTVAFFTIINYIIILIVLVNSTESFEHVESIFLIFGIGAFISILSSTIIIRHQLENNPPFQYTLIKLSVAHVPVMSAFFLTIVYFLLD